MQVCVTVPAAFVQVNVSPACSAIPGRNCWHREPDPRTWTISPTALPLSRTRFAREKQACVSTKKAEDGTV